jgi:DNA polymerase II small subunit
MEDLWEKFVSWMKEHKEVKYLFIAGDIVDGVGMYGGQESSLDIDTFEGQMEAFAKYLSEIRGDLRIFIISGNHDPNRDSEPQPAFPEDIAHSLKKIAGVEVYSNPAWLEVEGITILMYHGTSFDGLIDAIDPIRSLAYRQPYLAQIQLLRKRHLSPIFGKNKIFPDKEDFLVVNQVPHVFHTGHIHRSGLSSYKGVKLISSGTFQNITDFQEKLGHEPTPGQFILMNLSDGASRILDFSKIQ